MQRLSAARKSVILAEDQTAITFLAADILRASLTRKLLKYWDCMTTSVSHGTGPQHSN